MHSCLYQHNFIIVFSLMFSLFFFEVLMVTQLPSSVSFSSISISLICKTFNSLSSKLSKQTIAMKKAREKKKSFLFAADANKSITEVTIIIAIIEEECLSHSELLSYNFFVLFLFFYLCS